MNDDAVLQNISKLEDLEKELWLLFGNEINDQDREKIMLVEDQKERVLELWNYIRIHELDSKVLGKEVKPDDIQTVVQNYLRDKKDKTPIKSDIIKRLGLYIRTKNPILELPEMVDALLVFGLSKDQAYDYVINEFGKEMGIDKAVIPKYYEAVNTINTFAKTGKIETILSKEVLDILKSRAIPALIVVKKLGGSVEEQKMAFEAVAATAASSDVAYQRIISFPYETLSQLDEPSVQQQFLKHSDPNSLFTSVLNYGKGKVADKVLGEVRDTAVKKFLATKIGTQIATKFAAAAAGTAVAPVVGTLIGFIAGIILPKIQDGISWTKRNFKKVAIGTAVTLGFVGGGVTWAVGSFVISYGVLNASKVLGTVGSGASFVFNLLPELVATEIVWPLVAIIIAVPIVIALILFIITNSALVVPFSQSEYFGSLFEDDGLVNRSSCPIIMTSSAAGSYNPTNQKGHGSNEYWSAVYPNDESERCKFAIPSKSGCYAPTVGSVNVCYGKNLKQCDTYGFAMDISSAPPYNVSLPQIDGKDVLWNSNDNEYDEGVVGWTYSYTDSTGKYSIMLKHVNRGMVKGNNLPSGTKLGSLYNQDQTHLHLEVQVDGRYVRPENYFCNK